jgi:tetratricopeptide (TPR) repeat protein
MLPTKTARESEDAKWQERIAQAMSAHEKSRALAGNASSQGLVAGTETETAEGGDASEDKIHPQLFKDKAAAFFKARNFVAAVNAYTAALDAMSAGVTSHAVDLACLSNRAACHLALGSWIEVVQDCGQVLEALEREDVVMRDGLVSDTDADRRRRHGLRLKCLVCGGMLLCVVLFEAHPWYQLYPQVRMGTAKANMGDMTGAVGDYQAACQLCPQDEQLQRDLEALQQRRAQQHAHLTPLPATAPSA